jgi:hypothetical protein
MLNFQKVQTSLYIMVSYIAREFSQILKLEKVSKITTLTAVNFDKLSNMQHHLIHNTLFSL